jgi:hypothetical protein
MRGKIERIGGRCNVPAFIGPVLVVVCREKTVELRSTGQPRTAVST